MQGVEETLKLKHKDCETCKDRIKNYYSKDLRACVICEHIFVEDETKLHNHSFYCLDDYEICIVGGGHP